MMRLDIEPEEFLQKISKHSDGPLIGLFNEICIKVAGVPFEDVDAIDPVKIHISYTFFEKVFTLIRKLPDGTKRPLKGEDIVMTMKYFPGVYQELPESQINVEPGAITLKGVEYPCA